MAANASALEAELGNAPLEEQIRRRAYEIYLARGGAPGNEIDDWLQAESEIVQARMQPVTSRKAKTQREAA